MNMNPALCHASGDGSATAIVSGGTYPYQYQWSPSGGSGMTASNLASGNYTVEVSDDHGCSQISSITVTAPDDIVLNTSTTSASCYGLSDGTATITPAGGTQPYNYSWSPSGGILDVATNLFAGSYTVTVSDSHGCSDTASAFVSQPAPLSFTIAGTATTCMGQTTIVSANPSGGSVPYHFLWNNGDTTSSAIVSPTLTTVYTVDVEDDHGCSAAIQSVTVTVHPPLAVAAHVTSAICSGESVVISANASGGNGGPYAYSWNNGLMTGDTATVVPSHDSTFTVIASDGCTTPGAKDSVAVRVNPLPIVTFLPHLISGCTPVEADFLNYSTTPTGSIFLWDLGDKTYSNILNPSHLYTVPGRYSISLMIQTPQGCMNSLTIPNAVSVYGLPHAYFIQSSSIVSVINSTVQFTDNSIDAINWDWDFGDHSPASNDQNPVHQYGDTGSYRIRLAVTSIGGCVDTTFGRLQVEDEFAIYIPNAFTPNGDGVNDGFIAFGVGYTDYDMWIMDRWGKQIFHSTAKDQSWDGSYYSNGTLCQNDVYEYIIQVHDKSGKEHKFIGHVTLVR